MTFQFENFQDFMTMSGHGPYVWACYGAVALLFVALSWQSLAGMSRFKKQQRAMLARQAQADSQSGDSSEVGSSNASS